LDFILAGIEEEIYYTRNAKLYKNNGNNFTELSLPFAADAVYQIRFFDFNNDGYLDIIAHYYVEQSGKVKIFFNNKFGGYYEKVLSLYSLGNSFDLGDIDNDSDIDIVVSGFYDPGRFTRIYRNNGDFTFNEFSMVIENEHFHDIEYRDICLLDFDSDGVRYYLI
jgi:hypothetical protein